MDQRKMEEIARRFAKEQVTNKTREVQRQRYGERVVETEAVERSGDNTRKHLDSGLLD
jgi:hypothetical protein